MIIPLSSPSFIVIIIIIPLTYFGTGEQYPFPTQRWWWLLLAIEKEVSTFQLHHMITEGKTIYDAHINRLKAWK